MSYILEALKKSEQTRGHGTAPGIQTIHSSSLNYRPATRNIWPWVLIAAVLLNLAVLLYFVFHKNATAPVTPPTPPATKQTNTTPPVNNTVPPVPQASRTAPQAAPQAANTDIPQQAQKPETDTAEVTHTQPYTANADDTFDAVDISQLPQTVRNQIPSMKFTAHVYSSDPRQRSVVINGQYVEEGANLGNGLILRKITPNGVIMDFRGHLFRTNVISGW